MAGCNPHALRQYDATPLHPPLTSPPPLNPFFLPFSLGGLDCLLFAGTLKLKPFRPVTSFTLWAPLKH